jgi:ketosteroid isomerase-like protein
MKNYIIVVILLFSQNVLAQNSKSKVYEPLIEVSIAYEHEQANIKAIQSILQNQTAAWNKGDLKAFMEGYWENDSLVFIGKTGPTYGYKNTLDNYKKNYPDASHMGKLHFDIVSIKSLNINHYFVIGKWFLQRSVGNVNGVFTLVIRKTKDGWKIISDHSS